MSEKINAKAIEKVVLNLLSQFPSRTMKQDMTKLVVNLCREHYKKGLEDAQAK